MKKKFHMIQARCPMEIADALQIFGDDIGMSINQYSLHVIVNHVRRKIKRELNGEVQK